MLVVYVSIVDIVDRNAFIMFMLVVSCDEKARK